MAAPAASTEPALELPKIVIADSRELPPPESWRYAEIPGFEILSNASDKNTQRLIHDFQEFNYAVDVAWPGLQQKMAGPVALIICGRGAKFDAFVPDHSGVAGTAKASLFLQDRESAAIVIDFEAKTINVANLATTSAGASAGNPEAELPSSREMAAANGEMEIDHDRQLYREYLHFLLSRAQPRFPAWFEEGLAQLFMGMKFDRTLITFAKLEDPNVESISGGPEDSDFNKALDHRALMTFQEMFAVTRDSALALNPLGSTWAKQSQAFVHLCLYGEGQRYQAGFLAFLLRLQKEPPSEALFKECFNKSYSQMLTILRSYQQFSAYKSFEWRVPKGQKIPDPPLIALREATQSEIGRIKGNAQRLAGHLPEARAEMVAPYIRGERDPQLLTALGLEEHLAGNDERARKFLAAAVKAKTDRPRAYLELARLQQKAARAAPAGADGGLSAAQEAPILELLREAYTLGPSLHEVYELLGETLLSASDPPKKDDVQIMLDGVNRFKGARLGMVYQAAALSIRIGELKPATALVEHGLRAATDESVRARFAALKQTLPPAAAAPAKP